MKKDLFEQYLEEVHAEDYHGLDDDMTDDYDRWIGDMDNEELIEHGNNFGQKLFMSLTSKNA